MENEYLLQVSLELRDEMSKNLENVNKELSEFKRALRNAGIDVDKLESKVSKNTLNMSSSLTSLAKTAKYTTIALAGVATASIKSFSDTEYAVKKVQTISSKSFSSIKTGAFDLAKTYGGSVEDILQANYDLVSSMGDIEDSHLILDQAAQLSMAGFTSLGGAINALSSVMNAYKMEASEVTKVSDILIQVQNSGVTTIGELEGSLSNVLPTAASLKIGFEEIAAAMATMTSNKIPTAQATTQLRQALAELAKEGTSADKIFREITGESFSNFIEKGGQMVDAFDLLEKAAKNNNKTLYDVFGSVEAAGAVLNLTGDNLDKFRNNIDGVGKASNLTSGAVKGLSTSFKTEFSQLKAVGKEMVDQFGEELIPYIRDLKKALEEVNIKELLSKENVDLALNLGKGLLGISTAIWAIDKGVKTFEITMKAATGIKMLMKFAALHPVGTALTGIIGGTTLLLNKANEEFEKRKKIYEELEKSSAGTREVLERVKKVLNTDELDEIKLDNSAAILRYVDGFKELKSILADGDVEKAVIEVNKMLNTPSRTNYFGNNMFGEEFQDDLEKSYEKLEKINELNEKAIRFEIGSSIINIQKQLQELQKDYTLAKSLGATDSEIKPIIEATDKVKEKLEQIKLKTDTAKKAAEDLKEVFKNFGNLSTNIELKASIFNMSDLEKAEEEVRELENMINNALNLGASKISLEPLIKQYTEVKNRIEDIKESVNFTEIKESFEKEFNNLNIEFEIFGTDEQERLLQTIKILESQISKSISEGMMGKASELGKFLKELKEKYKVEYEIPKKAAEEFEKNLKGLSTSVYQVADLVGGDFQEIISSVINGLSTLTSSLNMMGVSKDSEGILGGLSGFLGSGTIGMIAGGLGVAGAVGGVVSSIFGGSNEKRKKKNAENERKFEENTNALKELGEQIKANTAALQDFTNNLIASIAANPTLHRIAGGQDTLKIMEDIMMENKDFGQLSFLVKESKKTGITRKKKSYSKDREMSEEELLGILGYDNSITINEFDFNQIKKFAEDLDYITETIIKDWASSLTSRKIESIDMSGFDQYKMNVDRFINQIEMLQTEQKEFFKNTTLEAFEGINILDEKQLAEQYKEMFINMGIDTDKYSNAIKEMVDANKILITSMEDVRNSFIDSLISGNWNFVGSLGSYFQKIIKNAAMVVYDTLYSEVDIYFDEMFEKISNKLMNMKESENIDFTGFWNEFDFNKILEAQNIQSNFDVVLNDLRKKLSDMGISTKIIDSILPITALSEKISDIKSMLNNAMSSALEDNDFTSFEKGLGQSIYNSVKESLISAFAESEVYKKYIDKYFDTAEFEKRLENTTNAEDAFELMKGYMNNLNNILEANGMGIDNTIGGNKDEERYLGNSYYNEGSSEINISITQHFSGVYGEETMYKISKKGIIDALEEVKNQSKVVEVMYG